MDRKRKRDSSFEWTTAKCRRLLRPIASRLAPLCRLKYITDAQQVDKLSNSGPISDIVTENVEATQASKSRAATADPAWKPGPTERNLKRYSGKGRKTSKTGATTTKSPSAGNAEIIITLPTPFKSREARRKIDASPVVQGMRQSHGTDTFSKSKRRSRTDVFAASALAKQNVELHSRQAFEKIFELHQGVLDGFATLLDTTKSSNCSPRTGARSLMNTCLRKVPDYIEAEEEWRKGIDEDDHTDVFAEVYDELENHSSACSGSWLREVVRAHGVKLIKRIIDDKLVTTNTMRYLANMPMAYGARSEALSLSLAFAHMITLTRPSDERSLLFEGCLSELRGVTAFQVHTPSTARLVILDSLFESRRLRHSWMSTRDVASTFSLAVRGLVTSPGDQSAILSFLHNRIVQACQTEALLMRQANLPAKVVAGDEHQALRAKGRQDRLLASMQDVVRSLVTVLTAITYIDRNAEEGSGHRLLADQILNMLHCVVVRIINDAQDFTRQNGMRKPYTESVHERRLSMQVLTSFLLLRLKDTAQEIEVITTTHDLIKHISKLINLDGEKHEANSPIVRTISSVVCDLARCCGQSSNNSSQAVLKDLVQALHIHAAPPAFEHSALFYQVALESALKFARKCRTEESKSFAREVERSAEQQDALQVMTPRMSRTPLTGSKERSFRWEEGLCEFIAATPLPVAKAGLASRRDWSAAQGDVGSDALQCPTELSDAEADLHDSGYVSEGLATPAPSRSKQTCLAIVSSPDELSQLFGDDYFSMAREVDAVSPVPSLSLVGVNTIVSQNNEPSKITKKVTIKPRRKRRVPAATRHVISTSDLVQNTKNTRSEGTLSTDSLSRGRAAVPISDSLTAGLGKPGPDVAHRAFKETAPRKKRKIEEEEREASSRMLLRANPDLGSDDDELALGCNDGVIETGSVRVVVVERSSLRNQRRRTVHEDEGSEDELGA